MKSNKSKSSDTVALKKVESVLPLHQEDMLTEAELQSLRKFQKDCSEEAKRLIKEMGL